MWKVVCNPPIRDPHEPQREVSRRFDHWENESQSDSYNWFPKQHKLSGNLRRSFSEVLIRISDWAVIGFPPTWTFGLVVFDVSLWKLIKHMNVDGFMIYIYFKCVCVCGSVYVETCRCLSYKWKTETDCVYGSSMTFWQFEILAKPHLSIISNAALIDYMENSQTLMIFCSVFLHFNYSSFVVLFPDL